MNAAPYASLKISSKPHKTTPWLWFALFCAALALFPSHASAQQTDIVRAVKLYKQGYRLFFRQRYAGALSAFLQSRAALPKTARYRRARNELLYYIGVCYMELGSDRKAQTYLKRYLLSKPRKRDKDQKVKQRLATLKKRLTPKQPKRPPPRRPRRKPPKPPPPPPPSPHIGGWIVLGSGAGVLIAGLIAGVLAQQKFDETTQRYEQQQGSARLAQEVTLSFRDAESRGTAANILYGVGAAAAIAGVVMLFVWKTTPQPASSTSKKRPTSSTHNSLLLRVTAP